MLLVVLTVLFSQFMNAQKFWQGKALDVEIRLLDSNLDGKTKSALEAKRKWFDDIHEKQNNYGRACAGIMALIVVVIALAFPLGVWRQSAVVGQMAACMFLIMLVLLGMGGFLFAFGVWRP